MRGYGSDNRDSSKNEMMRKCEQAREGRLCNEQIDKSTQCHCPHEARQGLPTAKKVNDKLTISHSHSKRGIVNLNIVDLQHVHKELR